MWLTDARAPEGLRIYAIGDVHGCLNALRATHRAIQADLAARPVDDWRVVHLGDYVDRGPESRGVIDFLMERASEPRMLFLRGNHDEMFAGAMAGDRRLTETWLRNGGVETLESYGLALMDVLDSLRAGNDVGDKFPAAHIAFLEKLQQCERLGDYYFVHAGIDPNRTLEEQLPKAQLWIREEFLASSAEYEAVVVHGHTPVPRVAVEMNRIGIDTGAVFGGALSCLVLEGGEAGLLVGDVIEPLPAPGADLYADEDDGRGPGVLRRVFGGRLFGRR